MVADLYIAASSACLSITFITPPHAPIVLLHSVSFIKQVCPTFRPHLSGADREETLDNRAAALCHLHVATLLMLAPQCSTFTPVLTVVLKHHCWVVHIFTHWMVHEIKGSCDHASEQCYMQVHKNDNSKHIICHCHAVPGWLLGNQLGQQVTGWLLGNQLVTGCLHNTFMCATPTLVPRPPPRFYLTAMEKPRLHDKIWAESWERGFATPKQIPLMP